MVRTGRISVSFHRLRASHHCDDASLVCFYHGASSFALIANIRSVVLIQWQAFLKPAIREVPRGFTVPTNLAIFIFGFVFQLLFMYDAIRLRSTAQVSLACVLNAGFLPFAIFQRKQMRKSIDSLRGSTDSNGEPLVNLDINIWPVVGKLQVAIPFIVGVCTLLLVINAWYLKQYFSWQSYRNVGADAKLRKMRIAHQVFSCKTTIHSDMWSLADLNGIDLCNARQNDPLLHHLFPNYLWRHHPYGSGHGIYN
jgi:hypothetical protein